jgi:hypothetical protein
LHPAGEALGLLEERFLNGNSRLDILHMVIPFFLPII